MSEEPAVEPHELVPLPASGRRFVATRRVRWGDGDRDGRLRLDSIARYLQDLANDDVRDAGHDPLAAWVVRRTGIEVVETPAVGEMVRLTTWASGRGRCWAERRTSIEGEAGGRIETVSLWIFLDSVTGRPMRLTPDFIATYGEATGGRKVQARLLHAPPPAGLPARSWPLRATDLDGLGHVNNAATWAPVEDELDRLGVRTGRADLEYGEGIDRDDEVMVRSTTAADGTVLLWLTVGDTVRASAVVRPR